MDWWWRRQLANDGIHALIHDQNRIVSRVQLQAAGWSESRIKRGLRSRRWQTVHPGVYATHTGPLGYDDHLLTALLYAGPDAAWSHYTAAEQLGLLRPDSTRPVQVTIPKQRKVQPRPRVVIHRYRKSLRPILTDVAAGSHSLLELRYLRDVERRHALPTGTRQRAVDGEFTDVFYEGFGLVVELDGRLHLVPRQRWRDLHRDNRATLRSESTLRYGWLDVTGRPCEAAVQVLQVLRRTRPSLSARACGPSCPVG